MPDLNQTSYSRDAVIAAVRDYFQFITKLYLPESAILEPPPDGWPTITTEKMRSLGKTDEVIELLRHLSYIRNTAWDIQGAPWCRFMEWQSYDDSKLSKEAIEGIKICTEGTAYENVPAHVIGLTSAGRDWWLLLLDTHLGIIYWNNCPGPINASPSREKIMEAAEDYAPENEHEWRSEPVWSIADFFELLKDEFRALHFVPLGWRDVGDVHTSAYRQKDRGMIPMVQGIYRAHGWPNLEMYRKEDYLKAVRKALEEHHPDYAGTP